jgi:uncharacterized protein (DUF2235 family)
MPKRIALCFDGTWNTPSKSDDVDGLSLLENRDDETWFEDVNDQVGVETNVCRLYRSILRGTPPAGSSKMSQVKWYDRGVGADWYNRVTGGAFGLGLSRNIREGYKVLSDSYEDGDEVFVFGFSRGAYTARSLVGMIRNVGLLPAGSLPKADADKNSVLMEAYEIYRTRDGDADSVRALEFRRQNAARMIEIKVLGVWDTVGALGIPIQSFGAFNARQFEFHDTQLSGIVKNGFHAIAVDEHREPYAPTLWQPTKKLDQTIEQRWFLGAHSDVGGGYEDRELSDITLRWMQEKVQGCGLDLDPRGVPDVADNSFLASISDSFSAFLGGLFSLFQKPYYREVGQAQFGNEIVDNTVVERLKKDVNYRPKNKGLAPM